MALEIPFFVIVCNHCTLSTQTECNIAHYLFMKSSRPERFKIIEKDLNFNREQMGTRCFGVKIRQYSYFKTGEQEPTPEQWGKFEKATGYRWQWVATGKGPVKLTNPKGELASLEMEIENLRRLEAKVNSLKLKERLFLIPENLPESELKALHDFLDYFSKSVRRLEK
ncbi:hypothetical protein [Leptospira sanjuanensis]|uniref:hypothetical protein n=1 Tax=Leptospira sanjuanensis TaxID=2879643 RepID=UPI001EE7DC62|nr:hypothetical protein [Leptospira sanjuanensis]MCG6170265.1 hypothetical protein [Leptospira sanjuanensis]